MNQRQNVGLILVLLYASDFLICIVYHLQKFCESYISFVIFLLKILLILLTLNLKFIKNFSNYDDERYHSSML